MLYCEIANLLGRYLIALSLILSIPLSLAVYYEWGLTVQEHPQPHSTLAFLEAISIILLCALLFLFLGRGARGIFYRREALFLVVLIWFVTPFFGGLPYYLSGTLSNPVQCYFEAVSGFTTTGSSVMTPKHFHPVTGVEEPIRKQFCGIRNSSYTFYGTIEPVRDPITHKVLYEGVEAVGRAILFWRSMTQWVGGGGIVVFFVAILPILGVGGRMLFQSEVTGPVKDTLTPRIKETASHLWKIYLWMTFAETALLMFVDSRVGLFEALTVTFATISTGGFSTLNMSVAGFHSPSVEWVVILFMIFGSINFSLYFYVMKGKFYRLYEPELFLFLFLIVLGGGFVTTLLIGQDNIDLNNTNLGPFSFWEAFRSAFFQTVSAQSSTGFSTANFDSWPEGAQTVLLIVMYFGGMAGSTAGGIKIIRLYMLFKIVQERVESLFSPERVRPIRVGDRAVEQNATSMVLCFFVTIIAIAVLGTFLLVLDGVDPETSLGLVACMINNTGMSFRMAGPTESCAFLSDWGLLVSSLLMIFGRLEFFAPLTLLVPYFWRRS